MTLQLVTPPAVEPVALSEAKAFLRVGTDDDNDLILHLITSARQRVEAETGRALIARTYLETLDHWELPGRLSADGRQFRLIKPPLVSVVSVTTYNQGGAASLWDAAKYFVDAQSDPGRIAVASGGFPRPGRSTAGIEIIFTAGYGGTASDVPDDLREAIMRLVSEAYLNRTGTADAHLPLGVQGLLAPYKRVRL